MMTPTEQAKLITYLEKREKNFMLKVRAEDKLIRDELNDLERRISGIETWIVGTSESAEKALETHQSFPVRRKFIHKADCPTHLGSTACLCEDNLNP